MSETKLQNYYDILEIAPDAPQHEVHRAYQRAKDTYSPDSPALYTMFTPEEAKELLGLVEEAFSILGHHGRRTEYDNKISGSSPAAKTQPTNDPMALPEFSAEGIDTNQSAATFDNMVFNNSAPKATMPGVPEGFAKTKFSVYELDQNVEEEIETQTEFNGEFLRRVRNYKKINLDQVSGETRISRSYINAIESDDFSALPAPVFVRGFIIQLSKVLGLDGPKVASYYIRCYKESKGL